MTLEREVLDTLLVNAAVESGARFERAHVRAVHDGTPVRVQGDGLGDVSARVAIITTGADLSLLAPLRMILRRRASAAAVRLYVRSDAPLDRLLISYDRAVVPGYGWVFPLPEGRFNVGCGLFLRGRRNAATGLRRLFDAFVTQVPQAREVLAGARERTPLRGAALRCGLTGVVPRRGNILVAGEALGATFPATGEGIGKALETGELAAVCAGAALRSGDDDPLRDYSGMIAALAPRYRGYRIAQSWLAWPALCDLVARRVCASARLRALSEGILDETVDPRRLFSVRALAASLRR